MAEDKDDKKTPIKDAEEESADEPEKVEKVEEVEEPEEKEEKVEPEPAESAEAEAEPETPEPGKEPSPRESLRIQQLINKFKQAPPTSEATQRGINYGETIDADPEVIKQLEDDRNAVGQARFNEGLEQAKSLQFHTRLEIDSPKVESKYPQFDKESENFDPAVADAINSQYLNMVGYDPKNDTVANPNLRYADYVEAMMELVERAAGRKVEQTSKNIAKQAATTGIRPDGSSSKRLDLTKEAEDMSDEELDAAIARILPKK